MKVSISLKSTACILGQKIESYAAIYVPPNEEDVPYGEELGEFRGGGFIAMTWYKHRGQTEVIVRVDGWNSETKTPEARPLTLAEAETIIVNLRQNNPENGTSS